MSRLLASEVSATWGRLGLFPALFNAPAQYVVACSSGRYRRREQLSLQLELIFSTPVLD